MIRYWFTIVQGPDEGRTLELQPGITLLGRLGAPSDADPRGSHRWVLRDPAVSRTHCALTWNKENNVILTHLSHTNDTTVNGQAIKEMQLKPEQTMQIGLTVMVLAKEEIPDGPGWEAVSTPGWGSDAGESAGWGASEASGDTWNPT